MKYLVSACLAGENVRFDGKNCLQQRIHHLVETQQAVMICPEMAGGLMTPRFAAEITGGSAEDVLAGQAYVINNQGKDVTQAFIAGAYKTLKLAQQYQVSHVILKAKSPSCGSQFIYDGSFTGTQVLGNGVTAALLKQHGFKILSEDEFLQTHLIEDHSI